MARVFITGSSSGLGLLAGQELLRQGHAVVLHARNAAKADAACIAAPAAEIVTGDVTTIAGTRSVLRSGPNASTMRRPPPGSARSARMS